jgi:hypothetical protein
MTNNINMVMERMQRYITECSRAEALLRQALSERTDVAWQAVGMAHDLLAHARDSMTDTVLS